MKFHEQRLDNGLQVIAEGGESTEAVLEHGVGDMTGNFRKFLLPQVQE